MNWMERWGFIVDPREFIGKTILRVENLGMEYGCTHRSSIAIEFTDGTRGWILGNSGKNCMPSPREEEMRRSVIIKPEEIGQYVASKVAYTQRLKEEELSRKRYELEKLKKELGEVEVSEPPSYVSSSDADSVRQEIEPAEDGAT